MLKPYKAATFAAVLISVMMMAACPKRVSIADIENNPAKYADKEVAIVGTVATSYGVSIPFSRESGGIYKIEDGTGSIWVVTRESVPGKNAQLGVKGKIQNGFTYNGKNYGLVLIEEDRRFSDK